MGSAEGRTVRNLDTGSRATVGELGGSKVLRPLMRMIPFLRQYDQLRAEYITASEHVSRLQEHNRLLTVAATESARRLQKTRSRADAGTCCHVSAGGEANRAQSLADRKRCRCNKGGI